MRKQAKADKYKIRKGMAPLCNEWTQIRPITVRGLLFA